MRTRRPALLIFALAHALALLALLGVSGNADATVYHLDSEAGDDGRSGTAPDTAWKSLERVNDVQLQPGDELRLKRGATFRGTLAPRGSGTPEQRILIAAYGEGARPVIHANGAQDAIKVIDQAISDVSSIRGKLGAFQANTLESNANNLRATLENTTAAESIIRDTDFASEIATFTKLQTQLQAGATVLGNANQITSLVAALLQG